jgi:hypothetical protein
VTSAATFADFLNSQNLDHDKLASLCVDLVQSWAGGKDLDDIYAELITNAKDAGAVDNMLYQLEGDPLYAEDVALLILSSAWHYPELQDAIREILASGAPNVQDSSLDHNLALADLYGMYILARNQAQAREVAYRAPDGTIKVHVVEGEFPVAKLFDSVRDMYATML